MSTESKLATLSSDVDVFVGAQPAMALASLPGWGSLAILLVILHGETRYGITLKSTQVRACATVADLLKLFPEKS